MNYPESSILLHVSDAVARITLNRPDRLNAFAGMMRDELAEAIGNAAANPAVRVIVITGAGRAFSAGADLDVMSKLIDAGDSTGFRALVEAGIRVIEAIRTVRQPVIAGINGVAVGAGASLAIACDLRIASDAATIGFTFNRVGLHPDWGATYFLPRLVGRGHANDLVFSGRIVEALEAKDLGLFEHVARAAEFNSRLEGFAEQLAQKPPRAIEYAKRSLTLGEAGELHQAMQRETTAQLACFATHDTAEGVRAFREKRKPVFSGAPAGTERQ